MPRTFIALGSNLGDGRAHLDAAVRRLRAEPGVRVVAVSPYYGTAPVGGPAGQPDYVNAAAAFETERQPDDILRLLLEIEHLAGRVRTVKDGPRTLDLDLLFHGNLIFTSPEMTVPHPRLHQRAFVLVPLADIAADVMHPLQKKTIRELLAAQPAAEVAEVRPLPTAPPPPQNLAGVSALVTGSTAGIGAAVAAAFTAQGAKVITHGRRYAPGRHIVADLRNPAEVDRLGTEAWAAEAGGFDILVCNAGADTLTGDAANWSFEKKLEELLAVDLKAAMRLTRTIGERMTARGHGAILTIGWDQAETGMAGDSGQLFAAVKGAVMSYTRSLALSLAPHVRVNCLAPGWIRTAWGDEAGPEWQDRVRAETPLRAWGLPEDVAAAAVWLASPAARFVTGQTLRINGGAVSG